MTTSADEGLAELAAAVRAVEYPARIARVIELTGFGSRRSGEFLVVPTAADAAGIDPIGSLLGGVATGAVRDAVVSTVISVPIGDREAVAAGLACGGEATVLVQALADVPVEVWDSVIARRPVALVVPLEPTPGPSTVVAEHGHVAGPALAEDAAEPVRRFLIGRERTAIISSARGALFAEAFRPVPRLLVVGKASLADALLAQGRLLGWTVAVEPDDATLDSLVAVTSALGPSDALVVLSHDLAVSCAVLHAALTGPCGYVGALGSRHTQVARAARLADEHGLAPDLISRIHGPVGLDLGARSPEETAVAIVAEYLVARSGRSATSLRSGSGPVNG